MRLYFLLTGLLLLQACGNENKGEGQNSEEGSSSDLSSDTKFIGVSESLPICDESNFSQMYWVEAESKLKICTANGYVDLGDEGPAGQSGEKGQQGQQGPQGEQGPAGTDANPAMWVFDANNNAIGMVFSSGDGALMLSSGELFSLNIGNGVFAAGAVTDSSSIKGVSFTRACFFESDDCTGTCYIGDEPNISPMKNGAFYTGTAWVKATGQETTVSNLTLESRYVSGACDASVSVSGVAGYPITNTFDPGFALPLQTPLYFGLRSAN